MSTPLPFVRDLSIEYGVADTVSPLIRRVVAKNPSAFTFKGTGTYIVGKGQVAVIDPGPLLLEHVDALTRALAGETVTHILITHTHIDHSPAAAPFKLATGAKTHGFGPHGDGSSRALDSGIAPGPMDEGGDRAFVPDVVLREGDTVAGPGWHLTALETPGHTSNHLCFALAEENAVFTGDHIMGWSTTAIGPPDGDMAAYKHSLARFLPGNDTEAAGKVAETAGEIQKTQGKIQPAPDGGYDLFWPTHGPPVRETGRLVRAYLAHRDEREALILRAIDRGATTIPEIVARVYLGLDPRLTGAAGRSTLAHLIELIDRGAVAVETPPDGPAQYRIRH
jgi:glyoxylase-like metal-dependent hydrolase (beta-lactamase superfamily II)